MNWQHAQPWVIRFQICDDVPEEKILELAESFFRSTNLILMRCGSSNDFAVCCPSGIKRRLALGILRGYSNRHIKQESITFSTNDSVDG